QPTLGERHRRRRSAWRLGRRQGRALCSFTSPVQARRHVAWAVGAARRAGRSGGGSVAVALAVLLRPPKRPARQARGAFGERRGPESNRRIAVLQTAALPLGYRAAGRD